MPPVFIILPDGKKSSLCYYVLNALPMLVKRSAEGEA